MRRCCLLVSALCLLGAFALAGPALKNFDAEKNWVRALKTPPDLRRLQNRSEDMRLEQTLDPSFEGSASLEKNIADLDNQARSKDTRFSSEILRKQVKRPVWLEHLVNAVLEPDTVSVRSDEANKTMARLSALLSAVPHAYDPLTVGSIFKGQAATCRKIDALHLDCCHKSHHRCKDEEAFLRHAIQAGRAQFVFHRHAKHNPYIKVFHYCVFKSPLARCIQVEGACKQLGHSLRACVHPMKAGHRCQHPVLNCSGLVPNQLAQIDFNQINYHALAAALTARYPNELRFKPARSLALLQ